MKVVNKVYGLRSLAGVLGVAALALGLSLKLEGAPTVSQLKLSQNKVQSAGGQETTKSAEGSTDSRGRLSYSAEGLSHSAAVTNKNTSRLTAGSIPEGGYPVIATIHVDWRDDEGTRLRQAGKLVGPMPSMVQEGAVAAAGGCSFSINCDDANPCTIDTCNIPAGGPLGAGKCEYNPVPHGFNLAAFGCSDDNFCNGLESCKNLVCHGGDNNTLPCSTNTDCPGGLCYGACTNGTAPSCCADRDSCNEPFAVCDEDSDNKGDPCETDGSCRGGRCNRCIALCASDADCDDERRCTGTETCVSKVCYGGEPPIPNNGCSTDAECPDIAPGTCPVDEPRVCAGGITPGAACTEDANCPGSEGLCLGTCQRDDVNPCGTNARCNEGYCFGGDNDIPNVSKSVACNTDAGCPGGECVRSKCNGPPNPNSCKTESDCSPFGTPPYCNEVSPVCYFGRCCTTASEPECSKVKLAACAGPWYGSDDSEHLSDPEDLCGGYDPDNAQADAWGCPKYSSGFTQLTAGPPPVFPVKVGPVSDSLVCVKSPGGFGGTCTDPFDPAGRFHQIGDDYSFDNAGYMGLDVVRFVLNVATVSRLSMDVYDDAGNFVEDMNVLFDQDLPAAEGIVVLILRDPMVIPGAGWIVLRTSERFEPNSQFQWLSTTDASGVVGTNDPDALWINSYPGPAASVNNNFLKMCAGGANKDKACAGRCAGGADAGEVCLLNTTCLSGNCDLNADCPGSTCGAAGSAPGILAFEMAGDKPLPGSLPVGACCVSAAGTCTDGLEPWVCQGQRKCSNAPGTSCTTDAECGGGTCLTNVYHGDGSLCNRCNGGTRGGQECTINPSCPPSKVCVGGPIPGTPCPDGTGCGDIPPGTCPVAESQVCVGGATPGAACTDDAECPGSVGVCTDLGVCTTGKVGETCPLGDNASCDEIGLCSLETLFCTNAHAPGCTNTTCGQANCCSQVCLDDNECDIAGTCSAVACTAIAACGSGACCSLEAPYCELAPDEATCEAQAGHTWQGYGTDCDADNGKDAAQQHCCPIPNYPDLRCMSGPNNNQTCTSNGDDADGDGIGDADCRFCMGGSQDGRACSFTSDTAGGTCTGNGNTTCEGGLRNGEVCTADQDCKNGCGAPGVCRGRCVSRNSGGDNCMDAAIQVITVPSLNEAPKTITITGTNIYATRTTEEPENCAFNATDPMWWEGFSIDKCARVRLDFCCSDPVKEPNWGNILATCNPDGSCDNFISDEPDPFTPGQRASSRGAPWCVEDNIWETYLLEPGTYWKGIYSDLAGTHDDYQIHITVQACPTAACCKPDGACQVLTEGACEDAGGFFLAPPNVGKIQPSCTDPVCVNGPNAGLPCVDDTGCDPPNGTCVGTCVTGSCCTAPGVCFDEDQNVKMTRAICDSLDPPGNFIGGVKCKGGKCLGGDNVGDSCAPETAAADCPGSSCTGTAAELAQPIPCPLCQFTADENCQHSPPAFTETAYLADTSSTTQPTRVADDVKILAPGGMLKNVCVIGVYVSFTTNPNGGHCGSDPAASNDVFTVRVYESTSAEDYTPGALVGESATTFDRKIEFTDGGFDFYRHQLKLNTEIGPLLQDQVYWIQVSNYTHSELPNSDSGCNWYWMAAQSGQGNGIFFQDLCQNYTVDDANIGDISLCLNLAFDTPDVPERACCTGNECTKLSFADCNAANGSWQFGQLDCTDFLCPRERNDACDPNLTPFVREGAFEVNMYGLTRDGSATEECIGCDPDAPTPTCVTGTAPLAGDLWYFYKPTASGRAYIGACSCEASADSNEVVAIYTTDPPSENCPCPNDPGFTLLVQHDAELGQDVNKCSYGSFPNHIDEDGCDVFGRHPDVSVNVDSGKCYTVRVATFSGTPALLANVRIALAPAKCGNGTVEGQRVCLGGQTPGAACTLDTSCGIGGKCVWFTGEQCDPGNPSAVPPVGPSDSLCTGQCNFNCLCPQPVCGDSQLDSALGEECDPTAPNGTTSCNPNGNSECNPVVCRGPDDPDGECTCVPCCGNNRVQGSETCDGTDDEACGGALCRVDGSCRCEANCGNGIVEVGEACDPGGDLGAEPADALCKTRCIPKRCSGDDSPCSGDGQGTCGSGQTCDTKADSCTCPPAFCGNDYTEELGNGEQCDGADLAGEGRCAPDECRPPGDPAGECTCGCAVAVPPTNILTWRPTGRCTLAPFGPCTVDADCAPSMGTCKLWPNDDNEATTRALRFRVVTGDAGPGPSKVEAIRVTMVDLQHPDPRNLAQYPPKDYSTFDTGTARRCGGATTSPNYNGHHCASDADCLCAPPSCGPGTPVATDDGTCAAPGPACTGEVSATNANQNQGSCTRWVGRPWTFYEAQGPPLSGPYRASRLQCTPVYWDWKSETDGLVTVVGAEIVPSSEYSVQMYGATCIGAEKDCENVSAAVSMFTRRKGDLDTPYQSPAPAPLNQADVLDVAQAVASVKHVGPAHYRGQMQPNLPELNSDSNVLDIVEAVDSVKRTAYSFSGPCTCPSTQTCGASCSGCAGLCLRKCVGGSYDGQTCINNLHCPGGGYCNKKCVGGTNDNGPCSTVADCPGTPAGVCTDVPGTCFDKCGRCN